MDMHTRFGLVLDRIQRHTSIIRSRKEDAIRRSHNGASEEKLAEVVERLERFADELEKTV